MEEMSKSLNTAPGLRRTSQCGMVFYVVTLMTALFNLPAFGSVVGTVRGVIHDPQHRPVQSAMVMIKAKTSDWSASTTTLTPPATFVFNAVPLGEYAVTVAGVGFRSDARRMLWCIFGSEPVLHFALNVAGAKRSSTSPARVEAAPTDSATPTTVVDRIEFARTPGASRTTVSP